MYVLVWLHNTNFQVDHFLRQGPDIYRLQNDNRLLPLTFIYPYLTGKI